jgi:leader peptidase (prepilin peptidase) / N-methyltransferase
MTDEPARMILSPFALDRDLRPSLFVVALGMAATAALSFRFLEAPAAIASTFLGALMIAGADVDARKFLLPDFVTYGATLGGVAVASWMSPDPLATSLLGTALRAGATAVALLILRQTYRLFRGREGLGLGDVKLAAAIGAWLPVELIPVCFLLAALAALVAALARVIVAGGDIAGLRVPFGAFLCPTLWALYFVNSLGR